MDRGMPGWKALGFNSYKEFLNSTLWKEKRQWIIEQAKFKCERCGCFENLQVHHLNYINVGNEGKEDVIVLCKDCHKKEHEVIDEKRNS